MAQPITADRIRCQLLCQVWTKVRDKEISRSDNIPDIILDALPLWKQN